MSYPPLRKLMESLGAETPDATCEVIDEDTIFNAPYGYDIIELTAEDIKAINSGKFLLSNAGEYRVVIRKKQND